MKPTTKGIVTAVGSLAVLYVVYKLIRKEPIFMILPSFEKQREFVWAENVKQIPSLAPLKDSYFKTSSYTDKNFMKAWYIAKKKGEPTFESRGKKFNTKDGIGI